MKLRIFARSVRGQAGDCHLLTFTYIVHFLYIPIFELLPNS